MQITATIQVPITVNWTNSGEPAGEQSATATAVVSREVDDQSAWGAVGNWSAGQATAAIQGEGGGSSSGGGSGGGE